ncbi:MAG: hypothetical protein H0X26_00195 [Alphaproteobacteria bacterium]|nr:hypothetical protein [Alphaproteobacteria bacterium]
MFRKNKILAIVVVGIFCSVSAARGEIKECSHHYLMDLCNGNKMQEMHQLQADCANIAGNPDKGQTICCKAWNLMSSQHEYVSCIDGNYKNLGRRDD